KSTMDGYACRKVDLQNELEIVDTIYAGKQSEPKVMKNQCCKIMTGAKMQEGADFVFKKEEAEITSQDKVVCKNQNSANYVGYKGQDVRKGDGIVNSGSIIFLRHLPMLAGAGISHPLVHALPDVVVYATGTELVEPQEKLKPFQIRNTT